MSSRQAGSGFYIDVDGRPWEVTDEEAMDLARSKSRSGLGNLKAWLTNQETYNSENALRAQSDRARQYRNRMEDNNPYSNDPTPLIVKNAPVMARQAERRADQFGRAMDTLSFGLSTVDLWLHSQFVVSLLSTISPAEVCNPTLELAFRITAI